MKRLSLKYPPERVALSWNFTRELNGHGIKRMQIEVAVDNTRTPVLDSAAASILDTEPWLEEGIVFQLVQGGVAGVDYRVTARVTRDDGLIYQKISILPVREA